MTESTERLEPCPISLIAEAHLAAPQPVDARAEPTDWRVTFPNGSARYFGEADGGERAAKAFIASFEDDGRELIAVPLYAAQQPSAIAEAERSRQYAEKYEDLRKQFDKELAGRRANPFIAGYAPSAKALTTSKIEEWIELLVGISNPDGIEVVIAELHDLLAAEQPSEAKHGSTAAARDVLAERRRQVESEGWSPEHDDRHPGAMAIAAATYAAHAGAMVGLGYPVSVDAYRAVRGHQVSTPWPWDAEWWKPKDPRRDLVRSGALILAKIERVDRAAIADGQAQSLCGRTRDEVLAKPVAEPGGAEHLARSIENGNLP